MNVRANPGDFGGQVGGALEQGGDEVKQAADHFAGMIFETAANNAEIDTVKATSPIVAKYKSLEGLAAYAAAPQFEKEMLDTTQKIRAGLPGGAQRMYDANVSRRTAYAIQDYNSYATSQVKKATLDSNNAIADTAISRAGDATVASNDEQFGSVIGDIKHSVSSMMELQGYGGQTSTDPDTGKTTFKDTPEGKQAQTVYQSELDKRTSAAWENRLHVLADNNVESAFKTYQANRGDIPGEAQVKLDAYFTPKVKDYQARNLADTTLANYDQQYKNTVLTPKAGQISIDDAIHTQESGGKPHDYQIQPGTFAQYAKPGEAASNPKDQDAVYGRIMADLKKSYPDDPARQSVAYFSGKGNVAPAGSATPYINDRQDANGKSVSSYVADITRRVGAGNGAQVVSNGLVPSLADFYRTNYNKILDDTRAQAQAQSQHPDDPNYSDVAVSKVEQRINTAIHGQELSYKADNDMVMKAFNGDFSKGSRPNSVEQLRASSPDAAAAWDRMTVNNPQAANAIETRILTANAKGGDKDSREYGSGFYDLFKRVHADSNSPAKINNVTELYQHVGAQGDLTVAGLDKLNKEIEGKNTPEGASESDLKKQFFANAKSQISGANDGLHIKDPKGEELYLKFMAQAFPAIEKAKSDGKTPTQIYNPDSSDYVGKLIPGFRRPISQWVNDMTADEQTGQRTAVDVLRDAKATKDPTRLAAYKAELLKLGAIRADDVKVPRPE